MFQIDQLGQLGNGQFGAADIFNPPVAVKGNHNFESLALGYNFTCGLTTGSFPPDLLKPNH